MAEEKKTKAKKTDKKSDKKAKKNPFKAIGSFFKSVKNEGKKVVWPKAAEVWKNTLTVLVVILILGVIIYGIDLGLSQTLKSTKKYAQSRTTTTEKATEDEAAEEDATEPDTTEPTTTAE